MKIETLNDLLETKALYYHKLAIAQEKRIEELEKKVLELQERVDEQADCDEEDDDSLFEVYQRMQRTTTQSHDLLQTLETDLSKIPIPFDDSDQLRKYINLIKKNFYSVEQGLKLLLEDLDMVDKYAKPPKAEKVLVDLTEESLEAAILALRFNDKKKRNE